MKVLLPESVLKTIKRELQHARQREIGGVLVGEHVAGETFRVADISVQRSGGSAEHFMRDPAHHRDFLDRFFERTGHEYRRFNYLGEWHSHPNAPAVPSSTDCNAMARLVADPDTNANFAVLIIAKLHSWWGLQLSATAFRVGQPPDPADLAVDAADPHRARFRQARYVPHPRIRWI
jgi:[CysO sulfur-carrier protein]-S-L-cysteine hydrolase